MPNFYDGYQNQKVLGKIIHSAESGQFVKKISVTGYTSYSAGYLLALYIAVAN